MRQKGFSALIIVIILAAIGVVVAYYLGSQRNIKESTANPSPTSNNSTSTPENKKENWKVYVNRVRNYQIEYPSDWSIDTSKADTKIDAIEGAELKISKNDYTITIFWPSAYGPSLCIFDDESRAGAPEIAGYCEGEFKEFDGNGNTYRRLVNPNTQFTPIRWEIYTKEQSGRFVTVPPIRYTAPNNYNSNQILLMDSILSTFKSTN